MEQETTTVTQKVKTQNRAIFISRLIGYIIFMLFIPSLFLIFKFKLFEKKSGLNIGGWGMIVIILTAFVLFRLAKQASQSVDSILIKQLIDAFRKVLIPLLAATLCLYAVKDFWKELLNFFIILTICEPIAYVLNPFPELLKDKEDEKNKTKMIKIIELFWDKRK